MIELFEDITGWVIEFSESKSSQQRRKLVGMENEAAEGSFSIVDLSANWPANKPACHRAQCDDLVAILDSLFGQLQSTRNELNKMRSVVAAVAPQNIDQDEEIVLIDSFVPATGHSRRTDTDFELCESPDSAEVDDFDTKFDESDVDPNATSTLVAPPFEGWALGGATGIHDNTYLDWRVNAEEQISISVGKIESAFGVGDAATTICIDPLTCEFQVAGASDIKAFFVWDSKSMSLLPLTTVGKWRRLLSGQAIVATTSGTLGQVENFGSRDEDRIEHPANQTSKDSLAHANAEQLAACIARYIDAEDRVLVLKQV